MPVTLGNLPNYEAFAVSVAGVFRLKFESGEVLELTLAEATPMRGGRPGGRKPFSLMFRAAAGVYFPQGIYRLEHDTLGAMELFLVPIAPDGQGSRFEAVFG
ncbi:MAG: hypothetical protein JWO87_502 [Phycisphaerales bacterium]|nr:hypothetical protein [Phycisphaerales bacterium]